MIVGVVRLHRQEGAGADMEGQRFASDPGDGDRLQQRGREMQRRGGGGDGAVLFREHRLIVAAVGLGGRTLSRNLGRGSEERSVGQECASPCRSRWSPYPSKTQITTHYTLNHFSNTR